MKMWKIPHRYFLAILIGGALIITAIGGRFSLPSTYNQPQPTFTYEPNSFGCGDFFVYKLNKDNTQALSVGVRLDKLTEVSEQFTLDLAQSHAIEVKMDSGKNLNETYCTDVLGLGKISNTLQAKKGKAYITLTGYIPSQSVCSREYHTTVRLENISFFDSYGKEVLLPSIIFQDVRVGWCAG
jgi:hypothetical protein